MALLAGCSPPAETAPGAADRREAEAYSLYSAYLDHLAAENDVLKRRKIEFVLETAPDSCQGCDDLDHLFPPGALNGESRADFQRRARQPFALRPAFELRRASYRLAGTDPPDWHDEGVTTVRVTLSPAGFDDGFTQALFRVGFAVYECEGGGDVLMRKAGNLWTVAQEVVGFACE